MDQTTLVDNLKDDGQKLIDRLVQNGFDVTAACWIRASEDGQPFLYIASPLVDKEGGTKGAYRRVHAVIRQMPQPFWIEPLDVKLISPADPIAKAVHELHQRYPGKLATDYRLPQFGGISIEEAYIYPPITAHSS